MKKNTKVHRINPFLTTYFTEMLYSLKKGWKIVYQTKCDKFNTNLIEVEPASGRNRRPLDI